MADRRRRYIGQIKDMAIKAREWVEAHPDAKPQINFNYPPEVFLTAVPIEAKEYGFIGWNKDGEELLRHIGAFREDTKAPTVFMCRVAIEAMEKNEQG